MNDNTIERIRTATFKEARRGYDRRDVDGFLAELADWLESGGADEVRSETVKRELQRVGQKTATILSSAEDAAEQMRQEAERDAREAVSAAQAKARRMIEEGEKRRGSIESVIADLVQRRDAVIADMDRLTGQLRTAIGEHHPKKGADPFAPPANMDPLEAGTVKGSNDQPRRSARPDSGAADEAGAPASRS